MSVIDELEIEINGKSKDANRAIDELIGRLNVLTTSLGRINGTSITGLANGVNKLGTAMQTMKSTRMSDFNRLASGMTRLATVDTTNMNALASNMRGFSSAIGQLGTVSENAERMGVLASNIARLGYKSVDKAIANLPRLAAELNDLMVTLSKAPAVSDNLIQMTNALANLSSQGSKVQSATNSINNGFKNTNTASFNLKSGIFSLTSIFNSFQVSLITVAKGIKEVWKSVQESMDFIEVLNYFNSAFQQVADRADLSSWRELGYNSAEAYYNSFSERALQLTEQLSGFTVADTGLLTPTGQVSLGINPSQLIEYQAMFGQISSSMGATSESSLTLSNVLTRLGGDLASIKNMKFENVWTNLASGIVGMSRSVDKYGSNIRNVNLQQKLTELGIDASITALNQEQKALLRGIEILESTEYAWGDLADTLYQPANQLRLLEANFQGLVRTIGDIFLPIVANVLIWLNALTKTLQGVIEKIRDFFNIQQSISKNTGLSSEVADLIGELQDQVDGTIESVQELKNQLMGFDEINKLSDSGTVEVAGTGMSMADVAKLEEAFLEISKKYEQASAEAYDRLEDKIGNIQKKLQSVFTVDTSNLQSKINNIAQNITTLKTSFGNVFYNADVQKSFDDVAASFNRAFTDLKTGQINSTTSIFNGLTSGIADAQKELEKFQSDKIVSINNSIKNLLDTIGGLGDVWTTVSKVFESEAAQSIVSTLYKLANVVFLDNIENLIGFGKDLLNLFIQPLVDNKDKIAAVIQNAIDGLDKILEPLGNLVDKIIGKPNEYENSFIHKFLSGMGNYGSGVFSMLLDGINGAISAIRTFKNAADETFAFVWNVITGWWNNATKLWGGVANWIKTNSIDPIVGHIKNLQKVVTDIAEGLWIAVKAIWIVVSGWIKDNVTTPIGNTFNSLKSTITKAFSDAWASIKTTLSPVIKWIKDNVTTPATNAFNSLKSTITSTFSGIWSSIKSGAVSGLNGIIGTLESGINGLIDGINGLLDKFSGVIKALAKITGDKWDGVTKISKITIKRVPAYATGGFPEDGLFMANRGELVGQFSNGKTAVANNEQIIAGIEGGVERAVARVLAPYLADIAESSRITSQKEFGISERALFRSTQRQARNYTTQTGLPAF